MQLSGRCATRGVLAAALVALPRVASAQMAEDDRQLGYLFRYFADSDRVHVSSHYSEGVLQPTRDTELYVQWGHERVVVPGVAAPPGSAEAVDAITSASRPVSSRFGAYENFTKTRNQIDAEFRAKGCNAGYYVSRESDYLAQQVRGLASRDWFDRALNIAAGSSYGWDRIEPLEDDDTAAQAESKRTWHGDVVATHAFTPTTLVRLGLEWNEVRGLQHNPYRNVMAGGTRVPERHPDRRTRKDVYVRVNQYLMNESSLKLSYMRYLDDWGVRSHTAGIELSQYVTSKIVAGYRYRYYNQGSADFFREEYASSDGVGGYVSKDYRLSDFNAHLMGAELSWGLDGVFEDSAVLDGLALSLSYSRYFNTRNFSANILETGLAWAF
jgi:hypothetical protein